MTNTSKNVWDIYQPVSNPQDTPLFLESQNFARAINDSLHMPDNTLANYEAKHKLLTLAGIEYLREWENGEIEWILPPEFSEYLEFFNSGLFIQMRGDTALCIPLNYFPTYNSELEINPEYPILTQLSPGQQDYWSIKKVLWKNVPDFYKILLRYTISKDKEL